MKVGDYVRFYDRNWTEIGKIVGEVEDSHLKVVECRDGYYDLDNFIKSSSNIIDLIEYMDLLYIQDKVKLYGKNHEVRFFNPVRVDGFTKFEDGTHCIILNLDYFVDIKDLKIKGIITHEQIESMQYKVGE